MLILTPSWRSAEVMQRLFHFYFQHLGVHQRPRVLVAYGGQESSRRGGGGEGGRGDRDDLSIELFNGCDVLIATPHKLETLLMTNVGLSSAGGGGGGGGGGSGVASKPATTGKPKTNLSRVFHVVFVEADRLVGDRFYPSVKRILSRFVEDMKQFDNPKRRDYRHHIVIARSWTPNLAEFIKDYANKPVFIFAERYVCRHLCD